MPMGNKTYKCDIRQRCVRGDRVPRFSARITWHYKALGSFSAWMGGEGCPLQAWGSPVVVGKSVGATVVQTVQQRGRDPRLPNGTIPSRHACFLMMRANESAYGRKKIGSRSIVTPVRGVSSVFFCFLHVFEAVAIGKRIHRIQQDISMIIYEEPSSKYYHVTDF